MITTKNIQQHRLKNNLGGYKNLSKTGERQSVKMDKAMIEKIEKSKITTDEYAVMERFAELLPRGHRKLKLNLPELRDALLSNQKLNAMTNTQGLRAGGLASMTNNDKANAKKSTKEIKSLNQKDISYIIQNKNRVKNEVNLKGGFNPNPTSFKNNFRL